MRRAGRLDIYTQAEFSSLPKVVFFKCVSRSSISNIVKETCICLTKTLRSYVKVGFEYVSFD
ncbi:uncharacterized protein LOC118516545 isoform X2 [Anopheles stephensi]|uniref:uncharacterized protein LOC118516480 isoform X3 n=1 Tax=Anopheles stephensi TaxID=30069 RepID=UPI001658C111|nr:uncharacterized protein LOC118516480 isoform X3 [Anopheles stephensi]XP_035918383.1 uncharacterized protein LOC118516545 isoform X2 [Anopheles stephensi]